MIDRLTPKTQANLERRSACDPRCSGSGPAAALAVIDALPGGAVAWRGLRPAIRRGRWRNAFDGYFEGRREQFSAHGGLEQARVSRGHLQRVNPPRLLCRIHSVFGGRIDVEWAIPEGECNKDPVLLQVRPALFAIRRCETLSLANHKEILGDPPSPWMVGVINDIGRPVMRFFEAIDPVIADWEEPYAIELADRGWLNFSVFFRIMDRWGLPRTLVTEGIGGESGGPDDSRMLPGRFVKSLPALIRLVLSCVATMTRIKPGLRELDDDLARAESLLDIQRVNARALEFSVRTNFAIMSLLSVFSTVRKVFGLGQAAHVVTQIMMAEYAELAARRAQTGRQRDWLRRYGHRGPLEATHAGLAFCGAA